MQPVPRQPDRKRWNLVERTADGRFIASGERGVTALTSLRYDILLTIRIFRLDGRAGRAGVPGLAAPQPLRSLAAAAMSRSIDLRPIRAWRLRGVLRVELQPRLEIPHLLRERRILRFHRGQRDPLRLVYGKRRRQLVAQSADLRLQRLHYAPGTTRLEHGSRDYSHSGTGASRLRLRPAAQRHLNAYRNSRLAARSTLTLGSRCSELSLQVAGYRSARRHTECYLGGSDEFWQAANSCRSTIRRWSEVAFGEA